MKKKGRDYIVFPLDVASVELAQKYVRMLTGRVGMFKVGLEIFIQSGGTIIDFIHDSGTTPVFLDLKLHDIPATVGRAMERIAAMRVAFTTVHCGENRAMLEAAVKGAQNKVGVLGVTVLTSVGADDIRQAGFKEAYAADVTALVLKRAQMAQSAGCAGVVCSGREVKMLKSALGTSFCAVTPGIRPAWESTGADDQKRRTTPAEAVQAGSDYLVIGRPIRDASDPAAAADRIAAEIEAVL